MTHGHFFWGGVSLLDDMFSSVQGLRFPGSLKLSLSMLSVRCWSVIFPNQPGFELLLGLSLNFYVSRLFCFFVSAAMRFEVVKISF